MKAFFKKSLFPVSMAVLMVYGMETYNAFLRTRDLRLSNFLIPFPEFVLLVAIVLVLQAFVAGPIAQRLALWVTRDNASLLYRSLIRPACTVLVMCPLMSLVATLLFKDFSRHFFVTWAYTIKLNIPMAFIWQLAIVGPLLRLAFGHLMGQRVSKVPKSGDTPA